ncbi:MAG: hypothetical protein ACI4ES_15880 [Roseburia sp.]
MEKGKLGLRLSFYGVVAFILAFLGYSTLLFLLAGIVLIVEKNEWASRQVIQAICLCVVASVISSVLGVIDFMYDIPFFGTVWSTIISIINTVVDVVVLVFCLIGLFRNVAGKEADIPLASKFADWAFGIVRQAQAQNFQQNQNFNQQAQGQNFNQQAQGFAPQGQNFNQQVDPNAAAQQFQQIQQQ